MPVAVGLVTLLLAGCYVYAPLNPTVPQPGVRLAFELNDQGRVGMAGSLGPEVARVEGALVTRTETEYVLQVSQVLGLSGTTTKWSGETVSVQPDYVKTLRERRVSKGRTALLTAALTAAAVAFVATRNLLGFGGGEQGTGKGGGAGDY